jgi:hypothetical protein
MGFIDFLKKLIEKNRIEESERETENVAFDEVGDWVENKEKEIKDKEKEVFVLIKDRAALFVKGLDEKVRVLENIDIESKKVEERIKLIVRGNLNKYIDHVKSLIENIDNLKEKEKEEKEEKPGEKEEKEEKLEKFIIRINKIFSDFDKKSYMSYQKATFLIGKEMGDIKKGIIDFSKYLTKTFDKNKDIIDSSKIISFIKLKLKQIDVNNKTIDRADERIKFLDKKTKDINEKIKKILEEIEKIKRSESYVENLKKQEEIKSDEKELEREIYKLKEMIDFKILGNIFHVDGKKMNIIKSHKEGFQTAFQKDGGVNILRLLDEAELNNEAISAKIKQLNDKKEEIIKNKATIKKNEIEDLLAEIKNIKLEIEKLNNEKAKELKRCERLKISREKIINSIKQELAKINVIISDF